MKFIYLFISVALELVSIALAEYEWSGFVNNIKQDFDYLCPDDFTVTGVASEFDGPQNDRKWEYQCSSGGGVANVSSNCALQNAINTLRMEFNYECPDSGYIAGFKNEFSDSDDDRVWYPYCCTRTYSSLVNCEIPSSQWENNVEQLLNWTTTDGRVLTGVQTFFSSFNRDRRWRFKQCELQVNCGDPGIPDNADREGDSFLYQDTVAFTCKNGYYQSSGPEGGVRQCLDTGLWSDSQPVCTLCTDIENCADIRCTNPSDHYCEECESDRGLALGERGYENLNTSCEPLCSWLRSFCYPGECPGGYTSCNCTEGFSGLDCLTITDKPDLNSCEVKLTSPMESTTKCGVNATAIVYINYIPEALTASWDASFLISSYPPQPQYVHSYSIGITEASVVTSVYRMDSYPDDDSSTNTSNPCMTYQLSSNSPQTMVDCTTSLSSADLGKHTFLHGDWFKVGVFIINGGFLNITDLDSNATETHHYEGTSITPFSLFVIDTQPPTHCSVVPSQTCLTNQPILTESLVFNTLQFTWGGWSDTPSQVAKYRVEVYKLDYDSDSGFLDEAISTEYSMEFEVEGTNSYSDSTALPEEGPYSVILTITDTAGNRQYARRIIVYDKDSELKEDADIPLVISSGYKETDVDAFWHNSTEDPIVVSGKGHFFNENLKTDNWLAPVLARTPPVPPVFDDEDRIGVNNSLGVTALFYQYIIDQEGGKSIAALTQPASFSFETDDLALAAVKVSPDVDDGDSVTIWFEARDFKSNDPIYESVLVHIDSSPPTVEGLGLVKEGVVGLLSLYESEDLVNLDVTFSTKDIHSGLYSIEWTLETDSKSIGSGEIPVTDYDKIECLLDTDCICDSVDHCHKMTHSIPFVSTDFETSKATHDTDYYLTVTATNHAQLQTSLTKQFTVDLTPPLTGAVFEEHWDRDLFDIDYQTGYSFTVKWEGFFDRETAIIAYQYIIDSECKDKASFQYPNLGSSLATDTMKTSVKWTAPAAGTYYTTVVAFNGAYLPSDPVCSDGITIDTEPPVFNGVNIPGGRVQEGLVASDGQVWLIHENRQRSLIEGAGKPCKDNSSTNITREELGAFPLRYNGSLVASLPSNHCISFKAYRPQTYTPINTLLNVTWSASDNTEIRDYWIGIASEESYLESPDISVFSSTAGFAHYSLYNSVFDTLEEFYIVVKAIDLSMQESVAWVGPIVIDTSAPLVNGSLESNIEDDLMVVWWNEWNIVDDDDIFPLTFEYSIGRTKYGEDVLPFTSIPLVPHSNCSSTRCVAIETRAMGFLSGNEYHVTIKAKNTAGLATYVPADPYTVPFPLAPECLSVFEYNPSFDIIMANNSFSSYFSQQFDKDVLINSNILSVGWYGLTADHLSASFSVAVGTKPGLSDVISFQDAGDKNPLVLPEVPFKHGWTYYSTVKASNGYSTITSTSDGFVVLDGNMAKKAEIWNGLSDDRNEEYRISSSEIAAHWYYPASISKHISHYEWALFKANDHDVHDLTEVLAFESVGSLTWGIRPADLAPDAIYVSSVKACFKSECLNPVYSDGFFIASSPNSSNSTIEAFYTPDNVDEYGYSSSGKVDIIWEPFVDQVGIAYYEWVIGSASSGDDILTEWTTSSSDDTKVEAILPKTLSLHRQYYVTLRGINEAGLETSRTVPLAFSGDFSFDSIVVYDVSTDAVPDQNNDVEFVYEQYVELDYTNSPLLLSAVWPDLRYTKYNYSISTNPQFYSCGSPLALACGSTAYNGLTVSGLNLTHGETYYFCVQAEADNAFTPYPSPPEAITRCSDGIMAYLTPPIGTCAQMRPFYHPEELPELTSDEVGSTTGDIVFSESNTFQCVDEPGSQSSTSELQIVWNPFLDEIENGPHDSQVAYYEYAIGTEPGRENIIQFTKVGVVTSVIVTGLSLEHGLTYYTTIRGTDHTGQHSLVTSSGLVIDQTPPTFGNIWLNTLDSISATSLQQLTPQWDLVVDEQSGISKLYWSLGSEEGLGDLHKWTQANVTDLMAMISDDGFTVPDGQPIRLNLLAINNAGLASISSSSLLVYDSTPPCSGRVFNGPKQGDKFLDLDYTSDHNSVQIHWEPFSDPHTSILEYHWAIHTCQGCDDAVTTFVSTGLLTDVSKSQSLKHGETYFVTVKGCSLYSGCSLASSDKITVDVTGPVTAQLTHGLSSSPLSAHFQASRNTVSCHWSHTCIFDSESAITHYIYYIGTEPGDDSYVTRTTIPSSQTEIFESSPFEDVDVFPVGGMVYVTLEVYNGVGLSNVISSGGVVVNDVQPVSMEIPFIDVDWSGSLVAGTQYTSSALRMNWNFSDPNLQIDEYFWTLYFEEGSEQIVQPQLSHKGSYETLLGLDLPDGSVVSAKVIGCNQANLCVHGEAYNITVDSSPPIDGYFALETNTAASLPWKIQDGMSIRDDDGVKTLLNLSFVGFSDPHTKVSEYWAVVGSSYGGSDLYKPSNPLSHFQHSVNTDVFVATMDLTRKLSNSETIYVSLWAVNGVGLRSNIVQGTFQAAYVNNSDSGSLKLMRSQLCPVESCVGHCTCSKRGHLCEDTMPCMRLDVIDLADHQKVEVFNFVPQLSVSLDTNEPLFTAIADKLVGNVEYLVESPSFQFIEWSVGENGREPGSGVIDTASDPVWYPLVLEKNPIFKVSPSGPLIQGREYVFYTRVWYNSTHYALFESDGVVLDNRGPVISEGYRVREVTGQLNIDVDFIASTSELSARWTNVFSQQHSGNYSSFEICIGKSPGTDEVYPCTSITEMATTISSLNLLDNHRYYTSLRATNKLGITAISISDSFLVDITPPEVGVVFDGKRHIDTVAHTSSNTSYGRIFGFNDPHSGISGFLAGVKTPDSEDIVYSNNGISRSIDKSHAKLVDGDSTYLSVIALSRSGTASQPVNSTGSISDSSSPTLLECNSYSNNIVKTGSFDVASGDECTCSDSSSWSVPEHRLYDIKSLIADFQIPVYDGCCALELQAGSAISQTVQTIKGKKYTLSFWTLVIKNELPTEVVIECKGEEILFRTKAFHRVLCNRDGLTRWEKHIYVFTADSDKTSITLATSTYSKLIIDDVEVFYCQDIVSVDSNSFVVDLTSRPNTVTWPVEDNESGIDEFYYGIGTVEKGEQIRGYQSTGSTNWGSYDLWQVRHYTDIYFSVKATNKAGLSEVFYSEPVRIDETPPTLSDKGVKEVLEIGGKDLDYSASEFILFDWSGITDEESGIQHCTWAVGSSPGLSNIKNYTVSTESFANITSITSLGVHGDTIFVTVTCLNKAGYAASDNSNGLTILTSPPKHEAAIVSVYNPVLTKCPARGVYVSSSSVQFVWNGFVEPSNAPLYYQIKIVGSDTEWTSVDSLKQIIISHISLEEDVPLTAMVRAYAVEGMFSELVNQSFTIASSSPSLNDTAKLYVTIVGGKLMIDWKNAFTSSIPLYYELSIGSKMGSSSIRKLITTENTLIEINEPDLIESEDEFFLSIRAINYAGLMIQSNYMIDNGLAIMQ